jgi:hypothetical protein
VLYWRVSQWLAEAADIANTQSFYTTTGTCSAVSPKLLSGCFSPLEFAANKYYIVVHNFGLGHSPGMEKAVAHYLKVGSRKNSFLLPDEAGTSVLQKSQSFTAIYI